MRVLHHLAPEFDFLLDGHFLHRFQMLQHGRAHHVLAHETERGVELFRRAHHVVEGDVGILRHFHERRKRMQVPERKCVVTVARHLVQKLPPETHAPHFRDVLLRRIARVRVTRRARVERDVELDAAPLDKRRVFAVFQLAKRSEFDCFGNVQSTIHRADRVRSDNEIIGARSFNSCGDGI